MRLKRLLVCHLLMEGLLHVPAMTIDAQLEKGIIDSMIVSVKHTLFTTTSAVIGTFNNSS